MPFLTTGARDPISYLADQYDAWKQRQLAKERRNQALYGLEGQGKLGFSEEDVPNKYQESPLETLRKEQIARRVLQNRRSQPLDSLEFSQIFHPEEYELKNRPQEMANEVRKVVGPAMGYALAGVVPASLGANMLLRGLTGAGLNVGSSYPLYKADPESAEPLMDATIGAGAGMAGIPGALLGALLGWTPDTEAKSSKKYSKGGPVTGKTGVPVEMTHPDKTNRSKVPARNPKGPQKLAGGGVIKSLVKDVAEKLTHLPQTPSQFMKDAIKEQGLWRYEKELNNPESRRFADALYPFKNESLHSHGIEEYLTPEEILRLERDYKFAGGGAVKSLGKRMVKYFAEDPEHLSKVQEIIKETGGNWSPGSVEQATANIKATVGETDLARLAALRKMTGNPELGVAGETLGKWVEGPLKKYVQRDMGTLNDPIRALAEQDILHVNPEELNFRPEMWGQKSVTAPGQTWVAQSPRAKVWEGVTDNSLFRDIASHYQGEGALEGPTPDWLMKLSPESSIYGINEPQYLGSDLGFTHLTDELANALNPESGLPRNLLLNTEDMHQMGIDRAVRHVDKINKWRAKEMERVALADMKDIPVVKEYPEGYKWVELKAGDLPEGWSQEAGSFIDPQGQQFWTDPRNERLQKWLKQEGDAMGSCVGGYCEDVLGGRSRIFSLRDARGQPHVTVEVSSQIPSADKYLEVQKRGMTVPEWQKTVPQRIIQIKGKQNLAPKPEYLPFVQDFVKTQGPWSDVGDLKNTGLRDLRSTGMQFHGGIQKMAPQYTLSDIDKAVKDYLIDPSAQRYMTDEEILGLMKPLEEFAEGGLVESSKIEDIIKSCGGKYAGGGLVKRGGKEVYDLVQRILKQRPQVQGYAEDLMKQAPTSFEVLDPTVIAKSLSRGRGKNLLLTPSDFAEFAAPMQNSNKDLDVIFGLRNLLDRGVYGGHDSLFEPPNFIRRNFSGFDKTPFLDFGRNSEFDLPEIVGHEGRHSMAAIRGLYGNDPILTEMRGMIPDPNESHWMSEGRSWDVPDASRAIPSRPHFKHGGLTTCRCHDAHNE